MSAKAAGLLSPTLPPEVRDAARRGWLLFPCHSAPGGKCSCGKPKCDSPGKHPKTAHGVHDASSDLLQLEAWTAQFPGCNWGVATGTASGLTVVDIDGEEGRTTLADLERQGFKLPATLTVTTGRADGGAHCYYLMPSGADIRNDQNGKIGAHIDVRGTGGYAIIPPSVHATGKQYRFLDPSAPIEELPTWVVERLTVRGPKPCIAAQAGPQTIGKGRRTNTLVSHAGTMLRRGMPQKAIEAALIAENAGFDPPLPESKVRALAADVARRYPAGSEPTTIEETPQTNWPEALKPEAFYGVAGDIVHAIEPHSEADPAALLLQFLVGFGNVVGRQPHWIAEADRHPCNLYAVVVGQTAKGRKGTSWGQIQRILGGLDEEWSGKRVMGGLSSGEGLIWAVRDAIQEHVRAREKGPVRYEDVEADPGESDKRLLVVETEFARVLQVAEREANTLSAIMRQAWDTGNLRILTKKQAAQATDAYISIIAHVTKDELRRLLTDTAAGNGFGNRFLWVCARRSKLLPEGGDLDSVNFAPIQQRLQEAAEFARGVHRMQRDQKARAIWNEVYEALTDSQPGLLGSVTSRADPQTMRIACIYALLDCSASVRAEHLMAALAVWQYCEASARFIFGDALGYAMADEILRELRAHPDGMTRTEIRELFQRNKSSAEIGRALGVLQEYGKAIVDQEQSGEPGRPAERWRALSVVREKRDIRGISGDGGNYRVNGVFGVTETTHHG